MGVGSTERASRPRLIAELVVAVLIGLISVLFVIAAIVNALNEASDRGGQIAAAVIFLLLLVAMAVWGQHIEHRLRRHTAVAHAYRHGTSGGGRYRRGRTFSPVGDVALMLLSAGAIAGFGVGAGSELSQASRSDRTQSHGVAAAGIVTRYRNAKDCGRSSCSYTAAIDVHLEAAVRGRATTTVHFPGRSPYRQGQSIPVLVDPHDPAYAELPGVKFKDTGGWIPLALGGLFFFVILLVTARDLVRGLKLRRAITGGNSVSRTKTTY